MREHFGTGGSALIDIGIHAREFLTKQATVKVASLENRDVIGEPCQVGRECKEES